MTASTAKKTATKKTASAARKVTSVQEWKASLKPTPLEMPSGHTALVKRPGMQVFLDRGMIPNSLMPIVMEALKTGEMPAIDEAAMEQDPVVLEEIGQLINDVTVYCVVEPVVAPVPEAGDERDEDTLYVDEVDMLDKMHIFQFAVGGTSDLETFRESATASMGSVPRRKNVAGTAKRTAGAKRKR